METSGLGGGANGELGNNTTNASFNPIQISTDTWIYISAGRFTSFGIKSNGTLWSWGLNDSGQLGHGTTTNLLVPTQIGTDTNWATVNTNHFDFTVATKTDGSVWAWSDNYYGEFGNGTTVGSTVPVLISSICVLDTPEIAVPKKIMLYPNPTKDQLTIEVQNTSMYELSALNGMLLKKGSLEAGANSIDLSAIASGCYFIKVIDQNGNVGVEKVIKE